MNVLVVNSGSSSIKCAVIDVETGDEQLSALGERLSTEGARVTVTCNGDRQIHDLAGDHSAALAVIMNALDEHDLRTSISGIGHRVVHGGRSSPTRSWSTMTSSLTSITALVSLRCTTRQTSAASFPVRRCFHAFPTLLSLILPFMQACPVRLGSMRCRTISTNNTVFAATGFMVPAISTLLR